MKIKEMMADYERFMFGDNWQISRVGKPGMASKAVGAEKSFVFLYLSSESISMGNILEQKSSVCKSNKRRRKGEGAGKLEPVLMGASGIISGTKILLLNEKKYNVREAAQLLGIGQTTLRSFMKKGQLPVIRLDGKLMFLQKDLEEFIQGRYGHIKEIKETRPSVPDLPAHILNSPHLKGIYS